MKQLHQHHLYVCIPLCESENKKVVDAFHGNYFIVLGGYSVPYTSAAEFGEAFCSCKPEEMLYTTDGTEVNSFLAPSSYPHHMHALLFIEAQCWSVKKRSASIGIRDSALTI